MLKPIKTLFLITLLCTSTAVVAATMDYYPSKEQSAVYEGDGGLRKQYSGIDVWTTGAPPRRYVAVGKIYHSLGWWNCEGGICESKARMIAKLVKKHGADAAIIESEGMQGGSMIRVWSVIKYVD